MKKMLSSAKADKVGGIVATFGCASIAVLMRMPLLWLWLSLTVHRGQRGARVFCLTFHPIGTNLVFR